MHYLSQKAEETKKLGERLGRLLRGGEVIALEGDLGGGKTLFTKGIGKGLGISEEIVSPSFTIERQYPLPTKNYSLPTTLHHFDFYRLQPARLNGSHSGGNTVDSIKDEVSELYNDPAKTIVIEWAQNLSGVLPPERLEIIFEYVSENERELEFRAKGERYQKIVKSLKLKVKSI